MHDVVAASGGAATDDLALATSEIVTNTVLHGDGDIAVRVRRDGALARVEVHDTVAACPSGEQAARNAGVTGGLALVDAVAVRWGIDIIADDGKVVWFELVV